MDQENQAVVNDEGTTTPTDESTTSEKEVKVNQSFGEDEFSHIYQEDEPEAEDEQQEQTDKNKQQEQENTEDEQKLSRAEQRKLQTQNEIREARKELASIKAEIAQYEDFRVPTTRQLADMLMDNDPDLDEAEAIEQAKLDREEMLEESKQQINELAHSRLSLMEDRIKVMHDYDYLNPSNPEYSQEFDEVFTEAYMKLGGLYQDNQGNVISAEVGILDFAEAMDNIRQVILKEAKSGVVKSTLRKMSKANTPIGGAGGNTPSVDFDSLSAKEKEQILRKKGYFND